jgi:hypothetical protein
MHRQQLDTVLPGSTSTVFAALCRTLAYRRWPAGPGLPDEPLPQQGQRYQFQAGSVRRVGRIVEVVRPVGLTLKEVLHDPPCRVSLTLRWRIDPVVSGCAVRLGASYRLNHAATFRRRHWDERLRLNFTNQFTFLALNLGRMQDRLAGGAIGVVKRDLSHH